MPIVIDGERWDIQSGSNKLHTGTADYLRRIGATPLMNTEREVPSSQVDENGKLAKGGGDADQT